MDFLVNKKSKKGVFPVKITAKQALFLIAETYAFWQAPNYVSAKKQIKD